MKVMPADPIPLNELVPIPESERTEYKLHLASWNGNRHPLDVFVEGWSGWENWNSWRGSKNQWTRRYIFSLIDYYHENDKWLFGGVFKVVERRPDSYRLKLDQRHQKLVGRLMVHFERYQGLRGRDFYLEKHFSAMTVSELLRRPYQGSEFPGFENVNVPFSELETIISTQRKGWHAALKNVKGVYAVFDANTGKKYVGSAYGGAGVWARWKSYVETGHGWNDELVRLIRSKGIEYAREHFRLALLEYLPNRTDDEAVIARESYWKDVLLARGQFGYNKN